MTRFGRLETVNLYDAWAHEAHEFTPWLAENLDRLGEVIGIQLEFEGREVGVRGFRADIVATNVANGSHVVIENQLDQSDNKHLGQVMTYLTGVNEAETVVWIAPRFRRAHLSAVRWLNKHTEKPFDFFAVQVRVQRIAGFDLPLVPTFAVVEGPGEVDEQTGKWDRQMRGAVESATSSLTEWRQKFWAHYAHRHPDDGVPEPCRKSSVWVPIGSGVKLSIYLAQGHVGVWARGERKESADQVRDRLQPWSTRLHNELDVDLGWEAPWGAVGQITHGVDTESEDPNKWDQAADWLHERIADWRRILDGPPDEDTEETPSGAADEAPEA